MRITINLLVILMLAACNFANEPATTEEIVVGVTVASTSLAFATETSVPANTAIPTTENIQVGDCAIPNGWVAYTVQAGDTLTNIARRTDSSVPELVDGNCLESADLLNVGQVLYLPQAIAVLTAVPDNLIYWLPSDNPVNEQSRTIGCQTYITPIESSVARVSNPDSNIRNALEILFATSPQAPYRNYWASFGLSVGSVAVDSNGMANIIINGDFLLVGTCGDAEIITQILLIVFAEPQVLSAQITVNGMNLKQMSDMSGNSGANAVFIRDDLPFIN